MFRGIPPDLKKIKLDSKLYHLHKDGGGSDFGMDNTPFLLDDGFGLYSTVNMKKQIGPVKTEYFRIGLTRKGSAVIEIGLEKYRTVRNHLIFGIPGQVFSIYNKSDDFLTYYMLFSEAFIGDCMVKPGKKYPPFLTYSGVQCFELPEEEAQAVDSIIQRINDEIKNRKSNCSDAIRLYIQLILITAQRNYKEPPEHEGKSADVLFTKFLKLLPVHFLKVRKVTDYASMLHVTAGHLNRAIKSCSDKTAHELIDEMILIEAKAYLRHSDLSVSEIAYKLDFSDPPHFSRFFKKYCGHTPLDYRAMP